MVEFFRGTITVSEELKNMPAGGIVYIQTDADIGVAFWNDADQSYGAAVTVSSPGESLKVFHSKALITAAAPAAVQIIRGPSYVSLGGGGVEGDGTGITDVPDFRDALRFDGWADPRDYGTITLGTGATTEQQTANVAAIQAALDTGRNVFCGWVGECRLNSHLTRATTGQEIIGANKFLTVLRWTSTGDGIRIRKDLETAIDQGGDLIFGGRVSNLSIIGPGTGTSTGTGIDIDDDTDAYNGDWVELSDCYIRGFAKGVNVVGVGQSKFLNCIIVYNTVGIEFSPGAQNSHQVFGCSIGQAETAIIQNSGTVVYQGGDYYATVQVIDIKNSASAHFVGGNFEGSGTQLVATIRGGGRGVFSHCQFLRSASTTPPIYVESLGRAHLNWCAGSAAGTAMVTKAATTAWVETLGCGSGASNMNFDGVGVLDTTQTVVNGPWPMRYYSSMPTGSVASMRGAVVQQLGISGFAPDGLAQIIQQKNGTLVRDWLNNYSALEDTPVTATTGNLANNINYIADNASLVTLTLPASATSEVNISQIRVTGRGAGGWRIAQNASQQIIFGASTTTAGVSGHLSSAHARDCVTLKYVATNTWQVIGHVGTPVTA